MYLGIDYGTSHIGLAVADIGIALPYRVLDEKTLFSLLPNLIEERGIRIVVVGVAIGYDPYGKQYHIFHKFIRKLQSCLPKHVHIIEQDEDLSTFEAQEALGRLNTKDHLDDVAASIILQRYLDTISDT